MWLLKEDFYISYETNKRWCFYFNNICSNLSPIFCQFSYSILVLYFFQLCKVKRFLIHIKLILCCTIVTSMFPRVNWKYAFKCSWLFWKSRLDDKQSSFRYYWKFWNLREFILEFWTKTNPQRSSLTFVCNTKTTKWLSTQHAMFLNLWKKKYMWYMWTIFDFMNVTPFFCFARHTKNVFISFFTAL